MWLNTTHTCTEYKLTRGTENQASWELHPLTLGSVFLQRTSLRSGGKAMVLQGETSPPSEWDKRMRKPMEEKEVRSRCGVNRHKTSPKSGAPWKRTIIISQIRANLTSSTRKSEMRTGLQAKSRDLCIFPASAPHLTSDQQLPPSVWQGFFVLFYFKILL